MHSFISWSPCSSLLQCLLSMGGNHSDSCFNGCPGALLCESRSSRIRYSCLEASLSTVPALYPHNPTACIDCMIPAVGWRSPMEHGMSTRACIILFWRTPAFVISTPRHRYSWVSYMRDGKAPIVRDAIGVPCSRS